MMTVILTKMSQFKETDEVFYPKSIKTNREIAVQMEYKKEGRKYKFVILGIHARNGHENNEYLTSINGYADVILGDFNAGNYQESENIQTFNSMLKDHVCICNMPTKKILNWNGGLIRKSCIDHIFVKRSFVANCSDMRVHEDIDYLYHYPISFKINL